ncbi:DUF1294 domain-containing protein [Vibrio sp. TRT 21S02]
MYKGKITEWNDERGFGFITASDSNLKAFVHASAFKNTHCRPQRNDKVRFDIEQDEEGRVNAVNASMVGLAGMPSKLIFAAIFLLCVTATVLLDKNNMWLAGAYWLMSIVTYILFALDKKAAKKGEWRTTEKRLLVSSFLCGWPGALFAQHITRHKTQKQPFKALLWIGIILNVTIYALLFTPFGQWLAANYL